MVIVNERGSKDEIGRKSITIANEDELRLAKLGYQQEVKRIFGTFTNFGLAASMISTLLGIIPLYSYSLQTGGPVVMIWSFVIVGLLTIPLVLSLAEICSAYPTMGALYYWAYRLGGPEWGRFSSWTAGWCNLLGQVAGVASGGYSGAEIIGNIITLAYGVNLSNAAILGIYAMVLILAGIVNTFSETLLTGLCYISVVWAIVGTLVIVIWTMAAAPSLQPASFVFGEFNNSTTYSSVPYVAIIGVLAAASLFTGYDTAAHVAEETTNSHNSTPIAMLGSILNALVTGLILIIGMNYSIQDLDSLTNTTTTQQSYTVLWQQTVGDGPAIFFLIIVFIAIECSNCANLTSASRMVYSFSRDGALPFADYFYKMNKTYSCPMRAIWLCVIVAFVMGVPGLTNQEVLSALFSLTATGLYASYFIPIFLRITVARTSFKHAEFNLGQWSVPCGIFSSFWCLLMTVILCLPEAQPITSSNLNYSPIALGIILVFAWIWWAVSARHWFKGAKVLQLVDTDIVEISSQLLATDPTIEKNLRGSLSSVDKDGYYFGDMNFADKGGDDDSTTRPSARSSLGFRGSMASDYGHGTTNPIFAAGDRGNNESKTFANENNDL